MTVVTLRTRITMRDDTLPHQIRLIFKPGAKVTNIAVSCTCMGSPGVYRHVIESRDRWDDPGEPITVWRRHVAEVTQ